jgi:hypothetical protein
MVFSLLLKRNKYTPGCKPEMFNFNIFLLKILIVLQNKELL